MNVLTLPTTELLRDILEYSPDTGIFRWKVRIKGGGAKPGKIAGHQPMGGYSQIRIDSVLYLTHRLAWKIHYGTEPPPIIDHIDLNPVNNSICNLREATLSQNSANSSRHKDSASPFKGIYPSGDHGRWCARITVHGHNKHLGSYGSAKEAAEAYGAAASQEFGKFARTS